MQYHKHFGILLLFRNSMVLQKASKNFTAKLIINIDKTSSIQLKAVSPIATKFDADVMKWQNAALYLVSIRVETRDRKLTNCNIYLILPMI